MGLQVIDALLCPHYAIVLCGTRIKYKMAIVGNRFTLKLRLRFEVAPVHTQLVNIAEHQFFFFRNRSTELVDDGRNKYCCL